MGNCDARGTVVVPAQTSGHVAGETDVIAIGILVAAEDIHEPAWSHVPARGTSYARAQAHAFVRHVRTNAIEDRGFRDHGNAPMLQEV